MQNKYTDVICWAFFITFYSDKVQARGGSKIIFNSKLYDISIVLLNEVNAMLKKLLYKIQ
jgi:hypothetical protein